MKLLKISINVFCQIVIAFTQLTLGINSDINRIWIPCTIGMIEFTICYSNTEIQKRRRDSFRLSQINELHDGRERVITTAHFTQHTYVSYKYDKEQANKQTRSLTLSTHSSQNCDISMHSHLEIEQRVYSVILSHQCRHQPVFPQYHCCFWIHQRLV